MKKQIILTAFVSFILLFNSSIHVFALEANPVNPAPLNQRDRYNTDLYTGSATYSYPVSVPKGTNGLAPDVSLNYSSQGVRDLNLQSGAGWQLSQDYIERDVNYTPRDTSDDKFKLHFKGQTYDLVYVASESRYHTKIESYLNIQKLSGSTQNDQGDYWQVTTQDGTQYRFGYKTNSESVCTVPFYTTYASRWNLDQIQDIYNNHIYYIYTENNGTSYPSEIDYNNDNKRAVKFTYAANIYPYVRKIYSQGCAITDLLSLQSIKTYVDTQLIHEYDLTYGNSENAQPLLTGITEKGSDGSSLPPTTFDYNPIVKTWNSQSEAWNNVHADFRDKLTMLIDVTSDGLPDMVKVTYSGGNDTYTVYRNTGSGWNTTGEVWLNNAPIDNRPDQYWFRIADVNDDGLPDLIKSTHTGIYSTWEVWKNTGSSWNSTSEKWVDNQPWDVHIDETNNKAGIADVNGDGLPDLIRTDPISGPYTTIYIWKNTGAGWNSAPEIWVNNADMDIRFFQTNSKLIDVNGDGLPDWLRVDNSGGSNNDYKVYYNTGSNWETTPVSWNSQIDNNIWDINVAVADTTGDNLPEVIQVMAPPAQLNDWRVYLNKGDHWITQYDTWESSINANMAAHDIQLGDANGDGLIDIVKGDGGISYVWKNNGYAPDLLSTIHTPQGGTIHYDYAKSQQYQFQHSFLPFPMWLISKMTVNNGIRNTQTTNDVTTYSYKLGFYNEQAREFRGFGEVDETDPNGAKKQTFFKQDDGLKGTMYQQKITDASGNLYAQTDDNWASNINNGVYINTLTSEKKYSYDGSASNPKISEIDYYYDGYGNIIKESDLGDTSATGDERYTYNEYVYNTTAYIINTLKHTYKNASDDSTKVSETWNYYDGNTGLNDTPTKGDLTKQVKWLSGLGATNPTTTYSYDSYGNKTQETDPNNHTTSYTYDTTGTNRISTTNAKNQTTNTSYDLGTGNLLSKTDPNGFTTSYTYDVFGRINKEIAPYDTSSYPTKSYTYYDNSTAPQGKLVSQRLTSGQSGTLDAYTYIDGLGRDIQKRIPAEDTTKQIVTDTFYDPNGKVSKVSVPHLDTLNTNYTTPLTGIENTITAYDPLQRVITVTNPQGTTKTTSYDHWKQTDTDENSHQKRKVMDAYNNITEVDEFNNGSTYVTTYQYNPLDKLTKITDANNHDFTFTYDTLGRKVSQVDPDMGTWTYTYDGDDNMTQQKDNRNKTTTKTYDELNRIASVSYPSDPGITYTYDGNSKIGTLTSVTDAAGTISYSYDNRLRKTQEQRVTDGNTWTTAYTYDAADRIVTTTKPDNEVVTYSYNAQGEVASVSGVVNNIDYNALNKVTSKTLANGQTTNYTYNTNDFRLNRIQTGTAQDVSYTYDNVGNVKTTTDNLLSKTQTFSYDTLDRLTSATESAGYNFSYTYDPIGNMTSSSGLGSTTKYTYGQNSLVHTPASSSTTTVMYDESVTNGWTDASFNATNATTTQTGNVYSGSVALASAIGANGGLDLQAPVHTTTSGSDTLHFALKASQPGQQYDIYIDSVFGQPLSQPVSLANYGNQPNQNGWTVYNIPLADLAATNVALGDIVIHNPTNNDEPIVYVDQLALTNGSIVPLTTSITDDWSSGDINTAKWNNWGGSQVSVVSNRLQISTTLGGGYYGVNSDVGGAKQDLTASYVMDQLIDAGNQSLSSWGAYPVVIDKDSNNQLYWGIETNKIRAYKRVGGTISVVNEATYNASIHKWFRIRESGGTIYWDYSTDGNSWTNFTSLADPFDVSNIIVGANVGTWQTESSTTSATFDNFNIVPAIPTSSTVTDNWSSGSINTAKWNNWGSPQTSVVSNQLKISSVLNGGYYGLDSYNGSAQDLTNSYVLNQLVDAGNQSLTSWEVYPLILLKNDDVNNSKLFFRLANNTLYASKVVGGVTTSLRSVSYNASTYKWFRIRESGGTTYFDTSADGKTWINFTSLADPFILTAVRNGMLVGTWQAESSSTSATFDNFNVPPAPPTATVTDNWSSGNIDTAKWNNWGSPQTSGVNGQLQISSVLSGGYFGLDSYAGSAQDLTGSYVIDQLVNAGNQSFASLDVYPIIIGKNDDFNNYQLYFMVANNTLYANKLIGGVTSTLRSASYNISTYKWFRIRESGGTIYYDTSSDGSNWNNFTSLNAPFNVAAVRSGMMLGTWNAESSTTTAIFDNFNIIP